MEGQIAVQCNHYYLLGSEESTGAVVDGLDRLARDEVPEFLSSALDTVLGNDPSVYVLRQVGARCTLRMADATPNSALAERWAEHLAGDVIRAIARSPQDGESLVRFADQGEYVAHFVTDLLGGRAWNRWFYYPFSSFQTGGTAGALETVLLAHSEHLTEVLQHLHDQGVLEILLHTLAENTLRSLWHGGLKNRHSAEPETLRPIFAHATRLARHTGLWANPSISDAALFAAYVARRPPAVDWTDPRALASALLDVLGFLQARGVLKRHQNLNLETFSIQLDTVLAGFDWLDTAMLRAALLELLQPPAISDSTLPLRKAEQGPTPRQLQLLQDLAAVMADGRATLDSSHPDSPANALRLYAALTSQVPSWAGEAMATSFIEQVLKAWAWLDRCPQACLDLHCLAQGDVYGTLQKLPEGERARAGDAVRYLARLGAPGLDLVHSFGSSQGPAQSPSLQRRATAEGGMGRGLGPEIIETECAGVYLLLRPILDARLPSLAEDTEYPYGPSVQAWGTEGYGSFAEPGAVPRPLPALLIALALRWAGSCGLVADMLDTGLGPFGGLAHSPTLAGLRESWAKVKAPEHGRFQAALLRVLTGQRLLRGSILHLYRVPCPGGHSALVAGDETARLWPLGRILEPSTAIADVVARWLDLWNSATGQIPAVVLDNTLLEEGALHRLFHDHKIVPVTASAPEGQKPDLAGAVAAHHDGRAALKAALASLDCGHLSLPETDLALCLVAIALLRLWARWLFRFSDSSVPYLLENCIRRPGRITLNPGSIVVEMAPRPLDVVIQMAGYMAELDQVPWLDRRRVEFHVRGLG